MSELQIFPVKKFYDNAKSKWQKVPAVPRGVDWHTYKASSRELSTATNIGIVIPQGVLVIDLDTDKGVTREAVEMALGCSLEWDDALLQQTVSGGQHYGFSIGDAQLKQGSDLFGVDGFDTRVSGKGWICSGDGYTDCTLVGLPEGIAPEWLPELPAEALTLLGAGPDPFDDGDNDLLGAIAAQPLDVTEDEILAYIAKLPASDVDHHDTWLNVGMALHHQFQGAKRGAEIWRDWSKASQHYDLDEIKARYKSFGKRSMSNPVTFAYVIHRAGGRDAIAVDKVGGWIERAKAVESIEDYDALKREIRATPYTDLPKDMRAMVAAELAAGIGKDKGMSRTDIKTALQPKSGRQGGSFDGARGDMPEWLRDWVYVEMSCEFAQTVLCYEIKREAFNAKYDREPECLLAEKSASSLALVDYRLPTVVDKIFWPGAEKLLESDGKTMLNTYRPQGCEPCDEIDEDGQSVIDRLLRHVAFTLSDEREQGILLDWLAYVVQNPGKRVNWAMLLQGAQGTGKSYFCVLLQQILGDHVKNLDPTAIAGRFTGWAHGSLVTVIEEIRMNGTNRYEVLDRMKPFLTNDTVQIEEKGRDHRTVPNFTSYMMLTNHKDAIPLTSGDRRYCVLFSRVQSEDQLYKELGGEDAAAQYFEDLFAETRRRPDALAAFLKTYKISPNFNPTGRAPDTKARQMMMAVSTSPERLALEDAIEKHHCEVINSDILDVTWLNKLCESDGTEIPKTRTLTAILLEMGYEQIEGKRI
ncbi:DUF5906 domain-containing protein, partial [Zhongshania sp.]|uniref:DUF5906 domain-containing protein n=1 Tax=Zhongshania sp. TaxID=1971902 RepID=UPI0035692BC3